MLHPIAVLVGTCIATTDFCQPSGLLLNEMEYSVVFNKGINMFYLSLKPFKQITSNYYLL